MTAYGPGGTRTYGSLFGTAPALYGDLGAAVEEPPAQETPPQPETVPGSGGPGEGIKVWLTGTRKIERLETHGIASYRTVVTLSSVRPSYGFGMPLEASCICSIDRHDLEDILRVLNLID